MSGKFSSTKIIDLGSCAFRQPRAESHCRYLHGYRLRAKFWFSCNSLDKNNWVVDFGSLKELKTRLESTFDHKTVISSDDPAVDLFVSLEEAGVIELVIMRDGVGIEKFAQYCFEIADKHVSANTNGRCWVDRVEVWEHDMNSAVYERQ